MASRRKKQDVDERIDLHGLTVEEMRHALQQLWPGWRGMRRVRIIHGQGVALRPELERWCREMGIPFEPDPGNPGSTRIFPAERSLSDSPLVVTLADKGLSLTPEDEAILRDPQAAARARAEALKLRQAAERLRAAEAAKTAVQRHRDEALWQAEVARLDLLDRSKSGSKLNDAKPSPPIVLPPSEIKHHEGYWRAELVRVADTDTDTLKKQKRTGLDKLAPPMEAKPASPAGPDEKAKPRAPSRNEEADRALFEAEMARLDSET